MVTARLPGAHLPEVICIMCPKELYLLPLGIVLICPKLVVVVCPKESVSLAQYNLPNRAEYCQIVIFKDMFYCKNHFKVLSYNFVSTKQPIFYSKKNNFWCIKDIQNKADQILSIFFSSHYIFVIRFHIFIDIQVKSGVTKGRDSYSWNTKWGGGVEE